LLGRVTGADTPALTKYVENYSQDVSKALSTSDKAPAPAASSAPAPAQTEKVETDDELNERMRGIMDRDKVVLFMKGSPDAPRCGFSRQTVEVLREQKVKFTHFDILQDEAVRQGELGCTFMEADLGVLTGLESVGLKKLNNWPTFPQLIIGGELMGGLDILREMVENGELQEALVNVGAK
jgi:glutaredoxin-related protein